MYRLATEQLERFCGDGDPGSVTMDRADPGTRRRLTWREWCIVLVGLATVALPDVMPVMVGVLQAQFGIGTAQAGYVISANMAGILAGTALTPLLARRFDDRTLLYAGLGTMIAGNLLTIATHGQAGLFGVRVVSGLGEGASCAVAYTLMAAAAQPARVIAFYAAGQSILAAGGMAALTLLTARFGPASFYLGVSLATLPALWLVAPVTRESGQRREARPAVRVMPGMPALLQLVAIFLFYAGMGVVWTFMQHIADDHRIGPAFTAATLSAAAIAGFVGSVCVATVAYRLHMVAALTLTGGAVLLCALGLAMADARLFFAAACLLKFAWGFAAPFLFRCLADTDATGRVAGLTLLGTAGALALSPAVGGALLEARGLGALIVCFVAASLGGLALAGTVHLYQRRRPFALRPEFA